MLLNSHTRHTISLSPKEIRSLHEALTTHKGNLPAGPVVPGLVLDLGVLCRSYVSLVTTSPGVYPEGVVGIHLQTSSGDAKLIREGFLALSQAATPFSIKGDGWEVVFQAE